MKKRNILNEIIVIFWIFVLASIIGYILEMTNVLLKKGYFETRQGLIYGPFIQVYGIGAIVYYMVFKKVHTRNEMKVFLITAILGGITEYICSFVQEVIFETISWDYSNLPFNINGRTSLLHCCYWGLAGLLYIKFLEPIIEKLKGNIDNKFLIIFTIIVAIFMIFDIGISSMAAVRQTERKHNIEAKNKIDIFLDKYYTDEFMDNIYKNRIQVIK